MALYTLDTMAAEATSDLVSVRPKGWSTSQEVVRASNSKELFFAVVGHVGSGTSEVAEELKKILKSPVAGPGYDVEILKARTELEEWDGASGRGRLKEADRSKKFAYTELLQKVGNDMREGGDHAAVAAALIRRIRLTRALKTRHDPTAGGPVQPDGQPRAYILDSIRHPAEVELLTRIYQDAFVLLGVVCDESIRSERLLKVKFREAGPDDIQDFMERDAKEVPKHGQRVSDAFHLSHYFLDNTQDRGPAGKPNPEWGLVDQLTRVKKILTHAEIVRPQVSETAMFAAQGAKIRSACLSRQVGAAIVNAKGDVIALGTNEVPKAGGGVYGTSDTEPEAADTLVDDRCHHRGYCSNTREQHRIIDDIIKSLRKSQVMTDAVSDDLIKMALQSSPIGSLLEFSRAVHAEMDALLSLVRRGMSAMSTRAFVTTFPCHYCARHLVAAGVSEVQYIEPYPKSKALELHSDSITTGFSGATDARARLDEKAKNKMVLFRPFVGVAPRLYARAFTKTRDLKDERGDLRISAPEWTEATHLGRTSYTELEAQLVARVEP